MELKIKEYTILIDEEDYFRLGGRILFADPRTNGIVYFKFHVKKKTYYLHRFVMNAKSGDIVDHINRNTLDNRKSNLRIADHTVNAMNANKRAGKSGFIGVKRADTVSEKWAARVFRNKKSFHVGLFSTPLEAAKARRHFIMHHDLGLSPKDLENLE